MEYTNKEKEVLSLMKKTDFKNLSKNDVLNYASTLSELRPEVAIKVIEQFPELATLIKETMKEYKDTLDKILLSDDNSTNQVYGILNKELDNLNDNRTEYYEFVNKIRDDLSKCLDKPNLSHEQSMEIIERQMELCKIIDKKDEERQLMEKEIINTADKKDTEKKNFNWKLIGTISAFVIGAVGISAATLGGNINFKLPEKK